MKKKTFRRKAIVRVLLGQTGALAILMWMVKKKFNTLQLDPEIMGKQLLKNFAYHLFILRMTFFRTVLNRFEPYGSQPPRSTNRLQKFFISTNDSQRCFKTPGSWNNSVGWVCAELWAIYKNPMWKWEM